MYTVINTKTGHEWTVTKTEKEEYEKDVNCKHYKYIIIESVKATKNKKQGTKDE